MTNPAWKKHMHVCVRNIRNEVEIYFLLFFICLDKL